MRKPNAGGEPRPKAAAQRRFLGVGSSSVLYCGIALSTHALLYVLGSHSQLFLGRIRAPPFKDRLGRNVVVLVQRQNVYVRVRHIEARGEHPDLPGLISGSDDRRHPSHHQHQLNKRVLIQCIELSLSRLNHGQQGVQAHPEIVQGTAEFHHEIADALLPQADAVFHNTITLDAAVDMLDGRVPPTCGYFGGLQIG